MPEKYVFQFYSIAPTVAQLLLAGLIFFTPLQKKRLYPLRLLFCLLGSALVLCFCVVMRTQLNNLGTRLVMHFMQLSMPFLIVLLCYAGSIYTKLEAWCSGVAAMEVSGSLFSVIQLMFGIDGRTSISFFGTDNAARLDWLLFYGLHLAGYLLIYRLSGRRNAEELDHGSRFSTCALTLLCMVFLIVPSCISNQYRADSYPLYIANRLYILALALLILALCNSIEVQSRYRLNMAVMDQVLAEERKQYQQFKENMDAFNLCCHDLKHQLESFSGKLTEQEIESLRSAMNVYDSYLKTGSEVLDVLVYTTRLQCQQHGIELTCLADGRALSFIHTRHLYSLLNNAIGNAVEAVKRLDEQEKRVISITVGQQEGRVKIEISNYFDGQAVLPGGTSKKDRSHHGFGLMSMQYVTQLYGGTLFTRAQGGIYCLNISIPIPDPAPDTRIHEKA